MDESSNFFSILLALLLTSFGSCMSIMIFLSGRWEFISEWTWVLQAVDAGMMTSIRCARWFTITELKNLRHNPFFTDLLSSAQMCE